MNSRLSIFIFAAFMIGPAVRAEIIVSPPSPQSDQSVTITHTRVYPSQAALGSESIAFNGHSFLISQVVRLGCPLPNVVRLTSEFDVGPLAAGEYGITVETELVSPIPDCGGETLIETSGFTVTGYSVAVPTVSTVGLTLTAGLLLLVGVRRIRAAGNPPPA